MKIYTKTGDRGQTSLFGGKRVSKADLRVETYGTIDELNSVIGVVIAQVLSIKKELIVIQHDLFEIGSILASPSTIRYTLYAIRLRKRVSHFEHLIDLLTSKLPALSSFILPGGSRAGSLLHFARTVCRRAERRVVALAKKEKVAAEIIIYLNRLSDLLFTMARFVNFKEKQKEVIWVKSV